MPSCLSKMSVRCTSICQNSRASRRRHPPPPHNTGKGGEITTVGGREQVHLLFIRPTCTSAKLDTESSGSVISLQFYAQSKCKQFPSARPTNRAQCTSLSAFGPLISRGLALATIGSCFCPQVSKVVPRKCKSPARLIQNTLPPSSSSSSV